MPELAERIAAAIDRAETLAQRAYNAEPGPWALHHNATRYGRADEWEIRDYDGDSLAWVGAENDARLIIAASSPDVVLRRCAADRRVLERHPRAGRLGAYCGYCSVDGFRVIPWPCRETRDLADRYGIEVEA